MYNTPVEILALICIYLGDFKKVAIISALNDETGSQKNIIYHIFCSFVIKQWKSEGYIPLLCSCRLDEHPILVCAKTVETVKRIAIKKGLIQESCYNSVKKISDLAREIIWTDLCHISKQLLSTDTWDNYPHTENQQRMSIEYIREKISRYKQKDLKNVSFLLDSLSHFPREITHLHTIRKLILKYNWLHILPEEIGDLQSLSHLDLASNCLSEIPVQIGQLHSLQVLDLSNNQLERLPAQFNNLKSLTELGLCGNQMKTFPVEICDLKGLRVLTITRNRFMKVPSKIKKLQCLEILDLDHNQINLFPKAILALRKLTKLSLSRNFMVTIPAKIRKLPFLEELNISHNHIRSLPLGIQNSQKLSRLILSGNPLLHQTSATASDSFIEKI